MSSLKACRALNRSAYGDVTVRSVGGDALLLDRANLLDHAKGAVGGQNRHSPIYSTMRWLVLAALALAVAGCSSGDGGGGGSNSRHFSSAEEIDNIAQRFLDASFVGTYDVTSDDAKWLPGMRIAKSGSKMRVDLQSEDEHVFMALEFPLMDRKPVACVVRSRNGEEVCTTEGSVALFPLFLGALIPIPAGLTLPKTVAEYKDALVRSDGRTIAGIKASCYEFVPPPDATPNPDGEGTASFCIGPNGEPLFQSIQAKTGLRFTATHMSDAVSNSDVDIPYPVVNENLPTPTPKAGS